MKKISEVLVAVEANSGTHSIIFDKAEVTEHIFASPPLVYVFKFIAVKLFKWNFCLLDFVEEPSHIENAVFIYTH